MDTNTQLCCICHKILEASKSTILTIINELLKFLIGKLNCNLLEDSPICESCLTKVQSAYKFKTMYLDVFQRTLTDVTVKEETDPEKCIRCEICKSTIQSDRIPLFDSVTENGFHLINYLSVELDSKIQENSLTCEKCHNSLINFYHITNSISIFARDITNELDSENDNKQIQIINNLNCVSSSENFEDDIKIEMDNSLADWKIEHDDYLNSAFGRSELDSESEKKDDLNCASSNELKFEIKSVGLTERHSDSQEGFVLKTEEVDLTMDSDEEPSSAWRSNQHEAVETTSNFINLNSENETELSTSPAINSDKPFKWQMCKFRTRYKENIKKHSNPQIFKCFNCEFKTKYKHNLKQHERRNHENSNNIEKLKCRMCDYKTKDKYYLKRHMTSHSDKVEMFKCQICEYKTKYKNFLEKHMFAHENPSEIFQCQHCEYQAIRKSHLILHVRRIHPNSDMEMFTCQICDYKTNDKYYLKRHMFRHKYSDEVAIFTCEICEFQTKYKSQLQRHILAHKNSEEAEMFKCQICEYKTKYKYYLKSHMLIHKSSEEVEMFKCQHCEYQTKHKNYLKIHIRRIHENSDSIETFNCPNCELKTKHKCNPKP